ncbi:alpha/beta-hydrolase [Mycena belliarum]|uniref:Alpha/beta-hydrolase n=1 Tax=Mycena belliarum TaxID=1033014 RepID=A0AAD6U6F5_9AGAR|nr:alpha/beta-hydrolase [Mycena belliae]
MRSGAAALLKNLRCLEIGPTPGPIILFSALFAVGCPLLAYATPLAVKHKFKSELQADVALRFVNNSGICETTPGVHQMSGYVDIGENMSIWFWFFASRTAPETAPFTLWINGGPGCASEIGLFQEHGPCTVNPDGESTTLNPFSWNSISNMIYIDQPIGTGFSFGTDTVNSTESAAVQFWKVFQVLFESGEFAQYQSREFIFATESYGGHYGPAFVTYFDQQNAAIAEGTVTGVPIVVSALMVNNGWYDPLIQNLAYLTFATDAPGYGQLQSDSVLEKMNTSFFAPAGCQEQEQACYAAGNSSASNTICVKADNFCVENLFVPAVGNRDSDDLRQNSSAPFPPEFYLDYLALASVKAQIGAESTYSECANAPSRLFARTGDDARTWLPQLGALANSTLKILIWAGDADINCNWLGGHASVLAMDWYGKARLAATPFTNMTIDGSAVAAIKNVDNFSFARVYAAGHEVPAFQPVAALEIFKQVIAMQPLHSV